MYQLNKQNRYRHHFLHRFCLQRKSTESEDDSDNEDQPSLPRNQPPQTTSGNKPVSNFSNSID